MYPLHRKFVCFHTSVMSFFLPRTSAVCTRVSSLANFYRTRVVSQKNTCCCHSSKFIPENFSDFSACGTIVRVGEATVTKTLLFVISDTTKIDTDLVSNNLILHT